MCGFMLYPSNDKSPYLAAQALEHRGADQMFGWKHFQGWTMVHTRLGIATDPGDPDAQQPWQSENGRFMCFVGEIFNGPYTHRNRDGIDDGKHFEFLDLESAMKSEGLRDFHNLDGFWSVAEIRPEGVVTVVTDHLGIKPVFYWREHNCFCSEIEPMFAMFPRPELDEVYLSNCIKWGYDYSGRTPYEGIRQMAPGSYMKVKDRYGFEEPEETKTYWNWNLVPTATYPNFLPTLEAAVSDRVDTSLYDVGLLLSGGVDSNLVRACLERSSIVKEKVHYFTVANGFCDDPEFPAEQDLPPIGSQQYELLCDNDSSDRLYDLGDCVDAQQSPCDLGSLIPQFELGRHLKKLNIRCTLTGDGADEVFGGYRRNLQYDAQHSDVFCELPYYHLPRLDRVMMRHQVEVRSPFLAPKIVKYGLSLPHAERKDKLHLRRQAARILPESVAYKTKTPLKSEHVVLGGLHHRRDLVNIFRAQHEERS